MAPLLEQHRDRLKPEVVWNIERGLRLTADEIGRAERERGLLQRRMAEFMSRYDLLLCPAAIVPPFPVETRYLAELNGHRFPSYIDWVTIAYAITLTACPALSLPCGFTAGGLPVGLQMVGRRAARRSCCPRPSCSRTSWVWRARCRSIRDPEPGLAFVAAPPQFLPSIGDRGLAVTAGRERRGRCRGSTSWRRVSCVVRAWWRPWVLVDGIGDERGTVAISTCGRWTTTSWSSRCRTTSMTGSRPRSRRASTSCSSAAGRPTAC